MNITDLTKVEVIAGCSKISNRTAEIAMSTAERLINEGVEQGMEKGIEKGMEKGVRALLALGMDTNTIAAALDVSPVQVKTIVESIRKGQ